MEHAVLILPSRDLAETLAFYGALGFKSLGEASTDHGTREPALADRGGNLLRIGSPLETAGA